MPAPTYYNECDPYAAQWIKNLISEGIISPGDVDTRSILDVQPSDLRGYTRCHFFSGIGVWDYALGLAGWPDDRPVWTGSCPCQPFSAAGGRAGFADERHLWPAWFHLISQCRPATVFGEQVAGADGLGWLDLVHADMDGLGYAFGASDLCAAGLGAPHIRQRLWFVADACSERARGDTRATSRTQASGRLTRHSDGVNFGDGSVSGGSVSVLADASSKRRNRRELTRAPTTAPAGSPEAEGRRPAGIRQPARHGAAIELADADGGRSTRVSGARKSGASERGVLMPYGWSGAHHGGWDNADWLRCQDGLWRPVEPGTFPLVDGASFRVGSGSPFEGKSRSAMLKGYGNAISPYPAAAFIQAFMQVAP